MRGLVDDPATTSGAGPSRWRGVAWWLASAAATLLVVGVLYAVWAAGLAVLAHQGALPPRSRVPTVPSGAEVVREAKECGSGGCWRELVVQPADGQSPADLAAQMGVQQPRQLAGRLLDPRPVSLTSLVRGKRLVVSVQY